MGFWPDYGEAMVRAGRADDAVRRFEKLTSDWPTEPYAWNDRAWFLVTNEGLSDEHRAQGLAVAQRAVELSNRQGSVMLATLAEAQLRNGDAAAAIATLEEVRALMDGRNAEWLTVAEVDRRLARYRER